MKFHTQNSDLRFFLSNCMRGVNNKQIELNVEIKWLLIGLRYKPSRSIFE